jgi:hypothetical protein
VKRWYLDDQKSCNVGAIVESKAGKKMRNELPSFIVLRPVTLFLKIALRLCVSASFLCVFLGFVSYGLV